MMNYMVVDDNHIQVANGIFGDVTSFQTYPSGELESLKLEGKNMVVTHAGELVPAFTETPRRKNAPSVEFYKNGMIKAVMVEEQSEVMTPIGDIPAEKITFYPTGEVHRVFITDGKISGFWTEEEEKAYNIPLTFEFDFAAFTAYLSAVNFYENGAIKSITLYPGGKVLISTPVGEMETVIGFSLYESGELESVEPAAPVLVETPIGRLSVHDANAYGVHADSNSVKFNTEGKLLSVKTEENKIIAQSDQEYEIWKPAWKPHPLYDDELIAEAMQISFDWERNTVTFLSEQEATYPIHGTRFVVGKADTGQTGCTPANCASCSLCGSRNSTMK
ncbi:hypothetical protein [Anaerocolumna xylanovorans]|uniref:Uncharacterized protein n=1 Tax=Anaerocolumna xylanovorans DSM 12503 TaxID=1121345 RepID=A0A1M7YHS4_9FIRM|nr:hypothetical protein [Anaerocolumna xylanovorans]SHO52174.1 hypothetical protein SAMN02745217_03553 [Anaerocolumna xylanovorans DSM 12503]